MSKNDPELADDQPKTEPEEAKKPEKPTEKPSPKAKDKDVASDIPADKDEKPAPLPDATADVKVSPAKSSPLSPAARAKALAGAVRQRNLKGTLIKVASALIAIAAIVVVIFGVLIYAYKSESPAVRAVADVIPYPVQQVNGQFVSYHDYLFEVDANEKAYQNNAKLNNQPAVNFKSAEGKKLVVQIKQHALEKLKSDAVLAKLAKEKKVTVTDKQVNDLINQLYDRYGGKDTLLKTLNQIYGWDINDLKGVIRKQLLAKNLEDKVTSDPKVDAAAKTKAQEVLGKVKSGTDFGELAKKYSQASDAASGGDLGFFSKGQLPDNVQAAAEALQPDQVSDVIKTQYGYEILKVVEKKEDGSIHGLHILIKTVDFNDYFQQELKKAKVKTYIKV